MNNEEVFYASLFGRNSSRLLELQVKRLVEKWREGYVLKFDVYNERERGVVETVMVNHTIPYFVTQVGKGPPWDGVHYGDLNG